VSADQGHLQHRAQVGSDEQKHVQDSPAASGWVYLAAAALPLTIALIAIVRVVVRYW